MPFVIICSAGLFGGSIGISAFGIYFLSASEVEKMPFQKAAAVAMRVAIAKNKLMGLLHKHDEAPACAEAAAGRARAWYAALTLGLLQVEAHLAVPAASAGARLEALCSEAYPCQFSMDGKMKNRTRQQMAATSNNL